MWPLIARFPRPVRGSGTDGRFRAQEQNPFPRRVAPPVYRTNPGTNVPMRLRKLLILTYIVRTKSPPIQLTRIVMHRIHLSGAAAALLTLAILGSTPADASLRVVASINPVHSLVSAVMAGVGEPYYLMRDAGSHHTFNLRPSDAAAIQDAYVIFLVDESIEESACKRDSRSGARSACHRTVSSARPHPLAAPGRRRIRGGSEPRA